MATVATAVSTPKPTTISTSTISALSLPFSSSQMFAAQSQRRRKRNTDGVDIWQSNSNISNSLTSSSNTNNNGTQNYLGKKRNYWPTKTNAVTSGTKNACTVHTDIKNEELAMRKKQTGIVFRFDEFRFVSKLVFFRFHTKISWKWRT